MRHMSTEAKKLLARAQTCSRADLDADEDLAATYAWRLTLFGEAASRITQHTRDQHPQVPWTQIVGMRNRLIHGYDAIDLDVVWQTVQTDLPPLVAALEHILQPPPP